jgi:hypothetical protein
MAAVAAAAVSIGVCHLAVHAQDTHADGKPGGAVSASAAVIPSHGPANSPSAMITFDFARAGAGVPVPKYKLVIHEDGTGSYEGEALPPPTRYGPSAASAAVPFKREVHLTPATTAHIFDLAGQLEHLKVACASKAKNIADTGTKTLTYAGPDGSGTCTYNYTDIKELTALTEAIQGITETLDEGRELDRLHRYDRLGLDSAMAYLKDEVAAGRALEVQLIGDSLSAIAGDADVLARVRAKASAMLKEIAVAQPERMQ